MPHLAQECTERGTEFGGSTLTVAVPEGQPAGPAVGGGDQHPVEGDLLDPPAGGTEREDVAHPRLVDHLLVEFAHPRVLLADHVHGEQAAVGDRAAGGDRESLGAGPAGEGAGRAVPHHPGAELGELVGRIATGEQVEDGFVDAAGERRERSAAPHRVEPVVDVDGFEGRGRDRLLGEHVQRIRRDLQRFDVPSTIRSTVTAQCTRSVRCLGNSTPREVSPTWCPARPTRCRPLATEGGASTWITRSTAPMSMPSSRLDVATTHRNRPDLRSSSIRRAGPCSPTRGGRGRARVQRRRWSRWAIRVAKAVRPRGPPPRRDVRHGSR